MNSIGFSQRLELRQCQALVMTPQLQQAIKMLQLSNVELADFIDAEVQQNPLLERREAAPEGPAPGAERSGAEEPLPTALPETLTGDFLTPSSGPSARRPAWSTTRRARC